MVLKSLKRIEELLAEYPELHIENESEDDIKISGRISIHRSIKQFVLKKAYEIEIFVPKHEDMLPYVIDKGKVINIEYQHIYENGQLCIATDVDLQLAFSSDPSLVKWMKDFVEPYFVSYEYYKRYGIYPLGERSHGADGIIQSYMDILMLMNEAQNRLFIFYTTSVTPAVQTLFDNAPGFVKQLRKSASYRNKIKNELQRLDNENPVYIDKDGILEYVWITVKQYSHGVPYHGRYYKRSGGTTHEITGAELNDFLFDKVGLKWDAVPIKDVKIEHEALDFLREHALKKNRLTQKAVTVSDETLIRNLQVLTKDGEYTRAAAMLFGNPEDVVFGAYIRIGFFENGRLKYQDEVHGPLISQAHRATEMIFEKYLKGLVDIKGLQRTETYMTTEELLREVILNAVAHKHYPSNVPIQIKVSDDHVTIMNEGLWPFENLAVEDVYNGEHSSYPANPTIDNGLFFAGAMDTWGQGFLLIKDECEKIDSPLPEIKATEKYVTVTIHGCRKYMELLNSITRNSTTSGGESGGEGGGVSDGDDKVQIIIAFCDVPHSKPEIQKVLGIKSERYVREKLINPLLKDGRLRRTEQKLNSKNQRYVSTKNEAERIQAIMDNNPVLAMSPGDLRSEGKSLEEYLKRFTKKEEAFYRNYYFDEM